MMHQLRCPRARAGIRIFSQQDLSDPASEMGLQSYMEKA
jgi:hypothetical protein